MLHAPKWLNSFLLWLPRGQQTVAKDKPKACRWSWARFYGTRSSDTDRAMKNQHQDARIGNNFVYC
ncbi:hypothetical protein [Mariniblastus fucicola]|uniref:hypothetical protein n=1 Tax=Mariniblastus fucicola TaxID=980251 RepID=UPI0009461886|nr:hypothetical protein [Mariniblastus fucicola]